MSQEEMVRKASGQFYAALNSMLKGDASPMANAWSHAATVTAMHPIGGMQTGWNAVRGSFEQVADIADGGEVTIENRVIHIAGDLAYEMGFEHGKADFGGENVAIEHRVTNVYRLEGGDWRVVHHHCDISPAMVKVVNSLVTKA